MISAWRVVGVLLALHRVADPVSLQSSRLGRTGTLHPGDRTYRNMLIRITDLTVHQDLIEGVTFENCSIVGPAVLGVLEGNEFLHCGWEGELEAIIWEIPEGPRIGAVGVKDCTFSSCRFTRIGLALTGSVAQEFRTALQSGE